MSFHCAALHREVRSPPSPMVDCVRIVHFMRNAMAHAGKQGKRLFAAFIATAFAQDTAEAAKAQWRQVADQIRQKLPNWRPSWTRRKPTCWPT